MPSRTPVRSLASVLFRPRRWLGAICAFLALAGAGAQEHSPPSREHRHDHDATTHHRFDDVEQWVEVFDDPERDAWQQPEKVLDALGIQPGMVVADIGAGTGYFAVRAARRVGADGKVYAVDIEPKLVDYLERRAREEGLPQVAPVLAEPHDPKLPEASVDLVLIVNTWHHIDDRLDYLKILRKALREGGRVAVVDWRKEELPMGPPLEHKLSRRFVVEEFAEAGWRLVGELDTLPYQYVLVFAPGDGS